MARVFITGSTDGFGHAASVIASMRVVFAAIPERSEGFGWSV